MSEANTWGINGRLVFWYTFDETHIYLWFVQLIEETP